MDVGDEDDAFDEILCPVAWRFSRRARLADLFGDQEDYETAGMIGDDVCLRTFALYISNLQVGIA
jgi:hypothetical protein